MAKNEPYLEDKAKLLDYIVRVINLFISNFGLNIESKKHGYILYYVTEFENVTHKYLISTDLEQIFGFCNLTHLLKNYKNYAKEALCLVLLGSNKYYNSNLINVTGFKSIKSEESDVNFSRFFADLNKYKKSSQAILEPNYLWTNYDTMHRKAIDNYFGTSLEEIYNKDKNKVVNHKFTIKNIRSILETEYMKIANNEITNFMTEFKTIISSSLDFTEYLLSVDDMQFETDILHLFEESNKY